MKKSTILLLGIFIVLVGLLFIDQKKDNNIKDTNFMQEVDVKSLDQQIIGSESPKIIYADQEDIIIFCNNVYIYNMPSQSLSKSFDMESFRADNDLPMRTNSFATLEGDKIIFSFSDGPGVSIYYTYTLNDDTWSEIDEEEYFEYLNNPFYNNTSEYIDKSLATVTHISENEYVYLLAEDMIIGNIEIVHVKDSEETSYKVFLHKDR